MKIIDKGRLTSKATKAKHKYFDKNAKPGSPRNPVKPGEHLGTFDQRISTIEAEFISGQRMRGDKFTVENLKGWQVPLPRFQDKEG
jgi:hypothetical protein